MNFPGGHTVGVFLAAAWAISCGVSPGSAQVSDQELQAACSQQIPAYVENMCAGRGVVADKWALALPDRCLSLGLGESVERQLRQCEQGNVYSDIWKFRYAVDDDIRRSFVDYVETVRSSAQASGEGAPVASMNVYEIYNITYLACRDDASCHAEFFDLIPDEVRRYLAGAPLYCDYHGAEDIEFDPIFADYLVDETSPAGFRHPVCRQFYCAVEDCGGKERVAPAGQPFILDEIWRDHYARAYGG